MFYQTWEVESGKILFKQEEKKNENEKELLDMSREDVLPQGHVRHLLEGQLKVMMPKQRH